MDELDIEASLTEISSSKSQITNVFHEVPSICPNEIFTNLLTHDQSSSSNSPPKIMRIISFGQVSQDWYNQGDNEWVMLIQGDATLEVEKNDEEIEILNMSAGDFRFLPKHQRHRVTFSSADPPCIWIAVHFD